ncbi:hypothetical protein ES703_16302 [subsurface metagenome]
MLEQITKQPEAIATAQEALVQTVAERWGYDFGRRTTQSELMTATITERTEVRTVGKNIKGKIADYLKNGTDVRDEVNSLGSQLKEAKEANSVKAKPFYEKIRPLSKAIAYLDKVIIPIQITEATGEKLLPRFQVADYTQKAIEAAKASK